VIQIYKVIISLGGYPLFRCA